MSKNAKTIKNKIDKKQIRILTLQQAALELQEIDFYFDDEIVLLRSYLSPRPHHDLKFGGFFMRKGSMHALYSFPEDSWYTPHESKILKLWIKLEGRNPSVVEDLYPDGLSNRAEYRLMEELGCVIKTKRGHAYTKSPPKKMSFKQASTIFANAFLAKFNAMTSEQKANLNISRLPRTSFIADLNCSLTTELGLEKEAHEFMINCHCSHVLRIHCGRFDLDKQYAVRGHDSEYYVATGTQACEVEIGQI